MVYIISKNYEHFNKALPNWDSPKGKYIRTKRQYVEAVKRAGLISYEKAEQLREAKEREAKNFKPNLSCQNREFLRSVQDKAKGNKVKLTDRQIDYMIKTKAIKDRDSYYNKLPKVYQEKGGFSNESTD